MTRKAKSDKSPEITPEMIEAGRYELSTFNDDFESPEDFLERLYEAMYEASCMASKSLRSRRDIAAD